MTLRKPVQSRCWRSYVADASVHRNLLLSSVRAASASKCLLLARCRLLVKKGERVARLRASLPECDAEDTREPRAGVAGRPTMMKPLYEARQTR